MCVWHVRQAWCGRLRANSKLRVTWRFCFGPSGREHTCALYASLKSGRREVRFDKQVVYSREGDRGSGFMASWERPGHTFYICEKSPGCVGAEASAAAAACKFAFTVDGVRWADRPSAPARHSPVQGHFTVRSFAPAWGCGDLGRLALWPLSERAGHPRGVVTLTVACRLGWRTR